jgi:hypothetical protein
MRAPGAGSSGAPQKTAAQIFSIEKRVRRLTSRLTATTT